MRNLSISARLLCILLALMIPIGFMLYSLSSALSESISFAELQIEGIDYEKGLLKLLDEVADYQVAQLEARHGETGHEEDIKNGIASIDALFANLTEIDRQVGADLKLTMNDSGDRELTLPTIKQRWEAVKGSSYDADAFSVLLGDMRAMIQRLGENSNMILDPELDSYYLVDASLGAFPKTLEKLAHIKSDIYEKLANNGNTIPFDDRMELESYATALEDHYLERTRNSIEIAIREDANWNGISPTLKPTLEPALAAYENSAKQLVDTLRSLERGDSIEATRFVEIGDVMHDGTADLGQMTLDELHKLITIRIGNLKEQRMLTLGGCGGAVAFAFVLFLFISRSLTRPIRKMTDVMKNLASGNTGIEVPSTENTNEIGNMAKAVLVFKNNMIETDRIKKEQEEIKLRSEEEKKAARETLANKFEASVKGIVNLVASAATQLSQTAENLMQTINHSCNTVNSAASGATQTSANVQSVASAAEEMSASVKEISSQVQNSNGLVLESVQKAASADEQANSLSIATQKVKEVIGLIADISGQINLLALNATIESARAGDAGKGFAVVASEVKNLASQTDKSVQEIDKVIQEMNSASEGIIVSLKDIRGSIQDISGASSTIAAAVEEQSASTNEIARNIVSAAQGTEVISSNLSNILVSSSEASSSSKQVLEASQVFSRQAEQLNMEVDEFLKIIRAA